MFDDKFINTIIFIFNLIGYFTIQFFEYNMLLFIFITYVHYIKLNLY